MQDISNLVRNLFLAGLISLGAPIAGCTVVEDDEPDARVQVDEDDDDVDIEVDD
jgi:hypothetical protein